MATALSESSGPEKRRAFRFARPSKTTEATLKVRSKKLPVRLVDESAGGFAILVKDPAGLDKGDVVALKVESCWHEVQVAYVRQERQAGRGDGAGTARADRPGWRIGFKRLRELGHFGDPSERLGLLGRLCRLSPLSPSVTLVLLTCVLTFVVVAVPVALIVAWYRPLHDQARAEANRHSRTEEKATGVLFQWPSFQELAEQAAAPRRPRRDEPADGDRPTHDRAEAMGRVADRLALSDAQQEEVRRIMVATGDAMERLSDDPSPEDRARVLQRARTQFLDVLTDEQRRQWEELSAAGGTSNP